VSKGTLPLASMTRLIGQVERIAKRANRYETLTSIDGIHFESRGRVEGGNGSP